MNRSQSMMNDDFMPDNDEDEAPYIDQNKISLMDKEQRKQFDLYMSTTCTIPPSHVKDVASNAVNGQCRIAEMAKILIGQAAKLFATELIEKAIEIQQNDLPLTPDSILIALSDLEKQGKIPGKGPGSNMSKYK